MKKLNNKKEKGFTLIELLIVIGIIVILAAVVIVAINPREQFAKTRETIRADHINTLYKAILSYQIEQRGTLPEGITNTLTEICNTDKTNKETCEAEGLVNLSVLVPDNLPSLPKDLLGGINIYGIGYFVAKDSANNIILKAGRTEKKQEGLPLTGWKYRRPITISNTSGPLTDYQVSVTLDTLSLISAGKMRSDCGDIRITDSDGISLLNYWLESGCNSASTKLWVKVPAVPSGNKIAYVYYGNSEATSTSNGDNVFNFFDDFPGTSINTSKWIIDTNNYSVSSGVLRINIGAVRTSNLPFNLNNGYILEGRVIYYALASNYSGTLTGMGPRNYTSSSNASADATVLYMRNSGSRAVNYWIGNGAASGYNIGSGNVFTSSDNAWYILGEKFHPGGVILTRNRANDRPFSFSWIKNPIRITLGAFHGVLTYNIQDTGYDWVLLRKYASPEPTTNVGNEEE